MSRLVVYGWFSPVTGYFKFGGIGIHDTEPNLSCKAEVFERQMTNENPEMAKHFVCKVVVDIPVSNDSAELARNQLNYFTN